MIGGPIAIARSTSRPCCPPALDELAEHVRHEAFAAGRAVVGADEELGRGGSQAILEDEQVLPSRSQDRHHVVAGLTKGAGDREHGGRADAAGHAGNGAAEILGLSGHGDVGRVTQRAGHVRKRVAFAEGLRHLDRRLSDRLHDQSDRSLRPIHVRDRQRDPLGARVRPQHHELPGTVAPGHARRLDLEEGDVLAQGFLDTYFEQDLTSPGGRDTRPLHSMLGVLRRPAQMQMHQIGLAGNPPDARPDSTSEESVAGRP